MTPDGTKRSPTDIDGTEKNFAESGQEPPQAGLPGRDRQPGGGLQPRSGEGAAGSDPGGSSRHPRAVPRSPLVQGKLLAGGAVRRRQVRPQVRRRRGRAFARAFDLPVTWFYLPPPPSPDGAVRGGPSKAGAKAAVEESALLVDLVFGDEHHRPVLEERLRQFLTQAGAARLTRAQRQISALAESRVDALVGEVLSEIDEWESLLRNVADKLDVLRTRARQAVEAEIGPGAGGAEGSGRPTGVKP